jgi:hypothetical protein
VPIPSPLRHLYTHLRDNHFVVPLQGHNPAVLPILAGDVLTRIRSGDATWVTMVPPAVARCIRQRRLFGCKPAGQTDR